MRILFACSPLLGAVCLFGCGQEAPKPAPQASQVDAALDQMASDADRAIRRQTDAVQSDLDRLADDLQGAVRGTRDDLQSQIESKINKARADVTTQVKRQSDEMAEYAAQMAEDAKDRALDIPDVLDEFFGSGPPRREGRRSDRSKR